MSMACTVVGGAGGRVIGLGWPWWVHKLIKKKGTSKETKCSFWLKKSVRRVGGREKTAEHRMGERA